MHSLFRRFGQQGMQAKAHTPSTQVRASASSVSLMPTKGSCTRGRLATTQARTCKKNGGRLVGPDLVSLDFMPEDGDTILQAELSGPRNFLGTQAPSHSLHGTRRDCTVLSVPSCCTRVLPGLRNESGGGHRTDETTWRWQGEEGREAPGLPWNRAAEAAAAAAGAWRKRACAPCVQGWGSHRIDLSPNFFRKGRFLRFG